MSVPGQFFGLGLGYLTIKDEKIDVAVFERVVCHGQLSTLVRCPLPCVDTNRAPIEK